MSTPVVLALLGDPRLAADAERVIAAAGARMVSAVAPVRRRWSTAAAVVLDADSAVRCVAESLPRRDGVILLSAGDPGPPDWVAAVEIGAQHVYTLPAQETELVHLLSDAVEQGTGSLHRAPVIAVLPGRGGGGASVFAAALTQCAGRALLMDLDPFGGGIDLLLGVESTPGLRWPDITAHDGRLGWAAVRAALPRRDDITVLSGNRVHHDVDPRLVSAMAEAGRRSGNTVVCDLPRHLGASCRQALELADLVVLVTACDVRGVAASAALAAAVRKLNANAGLVVRGPAPGGLAVREAAAVVGVPLLASMRPEPMLAQRLDREGLRLRSKSPLAVAARRVLGAAGVGGRTT